MDVLCGKIDEGILYLDNSKFDKYNRGNALENLIRLMEGHKFIKVDLNIGMGYNEANRYVHDTLILALVLLSKRYKFTIKSDELLYKRVQEQFKGMIDGDTENYKKL